MMVRITAETLDFSVQEIPEAYLLDLISMLSEFCEFVEHAEKELWRLFESIDRDHNGQLDKEELKAALARAGLAVPNSKLEQFSAEVDTNKDGVISFDEWRYIIGWILQRLTHV